MSNPDSAQIADAITDILTEMVEDLELEFEGRPEPSHRLIADLGLVSVDFIHLIVEIETRFGQKMGFHDLIMPDGRYVDDLSIAELTAFVEQRLSGGEVIHATPETHAAVLDSSAALTDEDFVRFQHLMPTTTEWGMPELPGRKNPRVVFLLSSPRSGSTLLRVVLAGNEALFAPPELHLLYYPDMRRRREALGNPQNVHLLTGTVRALMQLRGCGIEEAEVALQESEESGQTTSEFYAMLVKELNGRLLVDKTPSYTMRREFLDLAESHFDSALYIHLVRHPCGMMQSFEDGKMEQLIPFMRNSDFSRHQLSELTWLLTNTNIYQFLQHIPDERQHRVHYEDLVREPATAVTEMCAFLGVPYVAEMLDPYRDPGERMTDGLHTAAQFSGDLKFHLHARIEPDAAERWRRTQSESNLSPATRVLAEALGYSLA